MSNYIYLDQTNQLPLLDQKLIFVSPYQLVVTSDNRPRLLSNMTVREKNEILVGWATNESISYPRFNLDNYIYNIEKNNKIHILPNSDTPVDTDTVFDNRARELYNISKKYKAVYVFWSGGIDSTLILSAILKNWGNIEKLVVVLNNFSIQEHTTFYQNFIKDKIKTVSTDLFFNNCIEFNHENLYVTGDLGDPLITFDGHDVFEHLHPGILNKPWKYHAKKIIDYFAWTSSSKAANVTFLEIIKTSAEAKMPLETVHDFLWWINFNWGYDTDLIYVLWQYQTLSDHVDTKRFIEENVFYWFNSVECQNWTVSLIGTDQRSKDGISKYAFKKYIYDFDKDLEYFNHKKKEISTPKNPQVNKNKQILAIDSEYTMYYRDIKA